MNPIQSVHKQCRSPLGPKYLMKYLCLSSGHVQRACVWTALAGRTFTTLLWSRRRGRAVCHWDRHHGEDVSAGQTFMMSVRLKKSSGTDPRTFLPLHYSVRMYCALCEPFHTRTSVFVFAFWVSQCFSNELCDKKSIIWVFLLDFSQIYP